MAEQATTTPHASRPHGKSARKRGARWLGDGRPSDGIRHHLWCFIRQWTVTQALWLLLVLLTLFVFASEWAVDNHHDTWIAASALGLALLPAAIEGLTQIRLPRGFVLGIGLYTVATVVLGEMTNFYQHFTWWDVVMHSLAGATLAAMGLVIALTFLTRNGGGGGVTLPIAFAAFFTLGIGALWELFEYALDARFGFSTQNESLDDTMHDMAHAALSAVPILVLGTLHLLGRPTGWFGRAMDASVAENVR